MLARRKLNEGQLHNRIFIKVVIYSAYSTMKYYRSQLSR